MSVVSAIYKAPIVTEVIDENIGDTIIGILYDGKLFTGNAKLAENDKGFYSYRVGRNIALSKARMNAMNYEIKKSRKEMEYRYDFYQEATKYGKAGPAEVDPTGNFYHAITRYISRISALEKALKTEETNLKTYIKNQTKALSIVRKFRQGNNN
jgi:hypothetical protein